MAKVVPPSFDFLNFFPHHKRMFVRQDKRKNGRILLKVVENVKVGDKVKQKFICGLGSFHESETEEIQKIIKTGEEIIVSIKNKRRPVLPGFESMVYTPRKRNRINRESPLSTINAKNLKEESRIRVGIYDVFENQYKQLSLFDTIDSGYNQKESNELLKEMVLARIDKPSSKRKSVENIERDKNKEIDLNGVYRMMDKLGEREGWVKEKIARNTLGLFKDRIKVAFFDVTTLYFESFIPDNLRVSGFSKDNKVKETQVVLALMTTTDGLPLGYELFPGNTYEGDTLIGAVDVLRKKYEVVDASVIADRAMFTRKNLNAMRDRKVNFIVSAKLRTMKKEMKEEILNASEEFLKESEGKVTNKIWEYEYEGQRLVVSYSKKRADKDKKDRKRLLDRIEKKLKDGKVLLKGLVKNTGTKKYLKFEKENKEFAFLDENKIEEDARWDGLYGIASNQGKDKVSGSEIIERYRGLWQVEEAFRVNKSDMKMRPIYHYKDKRIMAHVLICYMAYALVATVKYKLKKANVKMSIRKIKEELGYVQASVVRDTRTRRRFLLPSKTTPDQRAIYNALGLKLEEKVRLLK